jgi:hypothetical protein
MSFEEESTVPEYPIARPAADGDDHTTLALAAGIVAALVAGGLWALLVQLTGYEIGYAAWGVGLLVGLAMSRVTVNRSKQLAGLAAAFAVLGLVAGKAFIFLGSTGIVADSFQDDPEIMRGAFAWAMYDEATLDPATLDEIDATIVAGDALSDALWLHMTEQAGRRLDAMSADERQAVARDLAAAALGRVGLVNGVLGQVTAFDLLWMFLALGTAYRMMVPVREEETSVAQVA